MKYIKYILIILIVVNCIFAQKQYSSEEWKKLTVQQRWEAMNLGQEKLDKMSTLELLDHCLNFNFMYDIYNHQNFRQGLEVIYNNHDALRELFDRKDSGKILLNFYNNINQYDIAEIKNLKNRGEFACKIFFLDLFISHPIILKQFQGKEDKLIKSILQTYNICRDVKDRDGKNYYSKYLINTKVLVIGRVLGNVDLRKYQYPAIEDMDLKYLTDELLQKIINNAQQYLEEN